MYKHAATGVVWEHDHSGRLCASKAIIGQNSLSFSLTLRVHVPIVLGMWVSDLDSEHRFII